MMVTAGGGTRKGVGGATHGVQQGEVGGRVGGRLERQPPSPARTKISLSRAVDPHSFLRIRIQLFFSMRIRIQLLF